MSAAEEIKQKIEQILVFPTLYKPMRLTSVVVGLIKEQINISIIPIGESRIIPTCATKKENCCWYFYEKLSRIATFGSALAIMYFHSDVNMNEAHQMIYYLISGEKASKPTLLSIAYSIGIGAGIFIFFEVYNKIKNKDNPGPLELEMHQSEKELRDFLRDQEGKK